MTAPAAAVLAAIALGAGAAAGWLGALQTSGPDTCAGAGGVYLSPGAVRSDPAITQTFTLGAGCYRHGGFDRP